MLASERGKEVSWFFSLMTEEILSSDPFYKDMKVLFFEMKFQECLGIQVMFDMKN